MKCLGIYRARRYSPGKSEGDREILDEVLRLINIRGVEVTTITEEKLIANASVPDADIYVSMARSEEALRILDCVSDKCVNAPDGIRACNHRSWMEFSEEPVAEYPMWIKRSDGCAEEKEDVSYCLTEEDVKKVIDSFRTRGIKSWILQSHYKGDIIKCYGVAGTDFFSYSYPTDTGQTKFGLESYNGKAHYYPFSVSELKLRFDEIANAIRVPVYGGDAIVDENGEIHIIDFNDWPTFSPCRKEAAAQIAELEQDRIRCQ